MLALLRKVPGLTLCKKPLKSASDSGAQVPQ